MATNHVESFAALDTILGRRLEKSSERFVKKYKRPIEKKVNDNFKCHSEPEF